MHILATYFLKNFLNDFPLLNTYFYKKIFGWMNYANIVVNEAKIMPYELAKKKRKKGERSCRTLF